MKRLITAKPISKLVNQCKSAFSGKLVNLSRIILLVAVALCVPLETNAQSGFDSNYLFEGTIADESSAYDLMLTGTESFSSVNDGQVFNLIGESYLDAPLALGTSILMGESFYMSIDFMMPDEGIDESARVLFGNKDWVGHHDGFILYLMNEKTAWQPEGIAYLDFLITDPSNSVLLSGRFYDIPMGEWHTVTFLIDFKTEMVTVGLDERSITQSLREDADGGVFNPEQFYQSLATQSIRIGGPQVFEDSPIEWHNGSTATDTIAELHVDNLRLASPRPAGSASATNSVLTQFTDHLNGTTPLYDAAAENLYSQLQTNLYGIAFSDVEAAARAFITSHNTNLAPLYIGARSDTLDKKMVAST